MPKVVPDKKETTIRLKLPTKRLLDEVAFGGETYDETIRRLAGIVRNLSGGSPHLVKKGNVLGMNYERLQRTFDIPLGESYEVVCSFNDLRALTAALQKGSRSSPAPSASESRSEWEIDLELLNVRTSDREPWRSPQRFLDSRTLALIYFVALRKIFEEVLFLPVYEFSFEHDYFSLDKWQEFYTKNGLSQESFYQDVEKRLREFEPTAEGAR